MRNICPVCNTVFEEGSAFCMKCGARLAQRSVSAPKFCTKCGSALDAETGLCPRCDAAPEPSDGRDDDNDRFIVQASVPFAPVSAVEPDAASAPVQDVQAYAPAQDSPTADLLREDAPVEPIVDIEPNSIEPIPPIESIPPIEPITPIEPIPTIEPIRPAYTARSSEPARPVDHTRSEKPAEYAKPAKANGRSKSVEKKDRPWRTVLCLVLLVAFIAVSFCTIALYVVRRSATKANAEAIVEGVVSYGAEKFLDRNRGRTERFYSTMRDQYDYEIDDKTVENIIQRSDVSGFLADKTARFFSSYMDGTSSSLSLTKDDVEDFVMDNKRVISKELDREIDAAEAEKIADAILGGEDKLEIINTKELTGDSDAAGSALRASFSYVTIAVFSVISLAILVVMIALRPTLGSVTGGAVLLIMGLPVVGAGVIADMSPAMMRDSIGWSLLANVLRMQNGLGLALVCAGIVLIALGIVIRILKKKSAAPDNR